MLKKQELEIHTTFFLFLTIVLSKFIFVRWLLFENENIFYTLVVELGYLLLVFGLLELIPFKKVKKALYITVNLMVSMLLLGLLIYHDYYGYIANIHVFSQIGQVGTVKDSVFQLVTPAYLLLFADFLILLIYSLIRKKKNISGIQKPVYLLILPVLVLAIGFIAGTLINQKDLTIANTVIAAQKQGLITYEILAIKEKASMNKSPVLTSNEQESVPEMIRTIKQITPIPTDELTFSGIGKNKNIIVIQAEAFQDFTLNLKIENQEITPFLNQLLKESIYFPNLYQQIGPGNTSDTEFMFNTSLYPSPWAATSETYGDRVIPSFPKLLSKEGYQSLTFHANDLTFWNRNNLYPALGFDQYYHTEFFGKEDVIGIGPSDEHLYNKAFPVLKNLHDSNQKFFAHFITLSSHHPFKIPASKDIVKLPKRFDGSLVGAYLESINYTDKALELLVQDLKEEGMWDETILVFYGDHFGLQPNGLKEKDFTLLEEIIGHEYTFIDQFNIPFIINVGGHPIESVNETVGGHIDMMPTVANILGLSLEDSVYFGQDLLNYHDNLFGVRYYMPVGSFFNNEIVFKPAEGFLDGEAFNLQTGELIQDFAHYHDDYERVLKLLKLSDDYLSSLPKR